MFVINNHQLVERFKSEQMLEQSRSRLVNTLLGRKVSVNTLQVGVQREARRWAAAADEVQREARRCAAAAEVHQRKARRGAAGVQREARRCTGAAEVQREVRRSAAASVGVKRECAHENDRDRDTRGSVRVFVARRNILGMGACVYSPRQKNTKYFVGLHKPCIIPQKYNHQLLHNNHKI